MLRLTVLALAMISLALSGCQRAESSAGAEKSAESADPSPEESGAMAAVAKKAPEKHHGTQTEKAHAGAEEGQSCAKGESCSGGCNKWDEAAADVVKRDVPETSEWQTLKVSGMTCGGCERRVIANVGKLDGVFSVEADAELGVVRVATAPGAEEPARLAAARIRELGYRVEAAN